MLGGLLELISLPPAELEDEVGFNVGEAEDAAVVIEAEVEGKAVVDALVTALEVHVTAAVASPVVNDAAADVLPAVAAWVFEVPEVVGPVIPPVVADPVDVNDGKPVGLPIDAELSDPITKQDYSCIFRITYRKHPSPHKISLRLLIPKQDQYCTLHSTLQIHPFSVTLPNELYLINHLII